MGCSSTVSILLCFEMSDVIDDGMLILLPNIEPMVSMVPVLTETGPTLLTSNLVAMALRDPAGIPPLLHQLLTRMHMATLHPVADKFLLVVVVTGSGEMASTLLVQQTNVWNVNFSAYKTTQRSSRPESTLRSTMISPSKHLATMSPSQSLPSSRRPLAKEH